MTTSELIKRATERLNKTGNPPLPSEETLRAIIELGNERDAALNEKLSIMDELARKIAYVEGLVSQKEEAELRARHAEDEAKEQMWIAHELGNFVRDLANGMYEGGESAAAKRVYDLNGGSLRRIRRNAYNYETVDEAKKAFLRVNKGQPYSIDELLEWMFRAVDRP